MKLLMWLLLGVLVYWALRSQMKRKHTEFRQHQTRQANHAAAHSPPVENMVTCAYCQIYLPASEAIHQTSTDQYFCSEEHARLHAHPAK